MLSEIEKKAVRTAEGPCMVVATSAEGRAFLVARVAHLFGNGVASKEVLVLASSVLAAETARKDITETAGVTSALPRITTFHALSEELVERHADLLGIKEDVRSMAPDKTIMYAQRLLGTDPILRNHYGKQVRYLLVNDFNALSASELAIVDLLGSAWRNICVIGQREHARTLFDAGADCFETFKAQYIHGTEIIL